MIVEVILELGRCFNIVMVRNLQAVGDVRFPVLVGIASQWIVGVGVAWLLGIHFGLGLVASGWPSHWTKTMRAVILSSAGSGAAGGTSKPCDSFQTGKREHPGRGAPFCCFSQPSPLSSFGGV